MFVSYKLLAYLGTQALKIKTQFILVLLLCNITFYNNTSYANIILYYSMFVSYKMLAYLGTQAFKIKTQLKLVLLLCNVTHFIALYYFTLQS
jgi:hypothetical protein